jgi:hypothetical protein
MDQNSKRRRGRRESNVEKVSKGPLAAVISKSNLVFNLFYLKITILKDLNIFYINKVLERKKSEKATRQA